MLLSGVKNNQASFSHFIQTKKTFVCMFVFYIFVFTLDLIILVLVIDSASDVDIDTSTFVTVFVVSAVVFLIPRIIGLVVVKNIGKGIMMPAVMVA